MPMLLAVDLGLRTGLALYGPSGRLSWYRSHNLGSSSRLRRAADRILAEARPEVVVVEGDRDLGRIWQRSAERRDIRFRVVAPEVWRERLLIPRQRRSGQDAKKVALGLARRVISWSGAPGAKSLNDDAAEAILIGLWGVIEEGWLESSPF